MNLIGFFTTKFILLLIVWIPDYDLIGKIYLSIIFVIKFIVDFNQAKPYDGGLIRAFSKRISSKNGNVIANIIQLIPNLLFAVIAIKTEAWLPAIQGIIVSVLCLINIKD